MRDASLSSADLDKLGGPAKLMDLEWAPCRYNCPVHADIRLYLEHIAQGRMQDAIDVIRDALPLAAVCGRICHHPCEANCRRNDVDQPVAIREVKRFVAELQGPKGSTVRKAPKQDKARVAIIGGGPAGLSAALELAKKGYRPTIFEKFPVAGGIPATAIPRYRMPREVLQMDVDWIVAHGVEIKTGVEIGKDKTIDDLLKDGFAAVLVATGLSLSRMLPLPGADHKRVYPVLEFLQRISFGPTPEVGKDVLVIGGGNVAVDAARSALRLGAERVRMMCLENEQEMPAWKWEQDEAREEGITFIHRRGPVKVHVKGGNITGLTARKVTRVFDENKRFNPAYDDRDTMDIECDTIIMAIGQMADTKFAGGGLKVDQRGRLDYSPLTHQTNVPNVFACGEIVTPPGSAVEACASGKRAAAAIDLYLSGKQVRLDDTLPPYIGKIAPTVGEKVTKVARVPVKAEAPDVRKRTFAQFDHSYVESEAMRESRRCMGCGGGAEVLADKCAACLTCLRVCPFGIPKVAEVARIDSALCQACGMCVAECPANAIIWKAQPAGGLPAKVKAAIAEGKGNVVAFICGHRATAASWTGKDQNIPGVREIHVPSMAGVAPLDILRAFENGAHTVVVIACRDGADRYPTATRRLRARIEQTRNMMREIGMPEDRLQYHELG
ncbi:MAG: FAD-dependent oxidoreductase [Phycisphaerae bacterium]